LFEVHPIQLSETGSGRIIQGVQPSNVEELRKSVLTRKTVHLGEIGMLVAVISSHDSETETLCA
jgi:hypothetical protein